MSGPYAGLKVHVVNKFHMVWVKSQWQGYKLDDPTYWDLIASRDKWARYVFIFSKASKTLCGPTTQCPVQKVPEAVCLEWQSGCGVKHSPFSDASVRNVCGALPPPHGSSWLGV